MRGYDQPDRRVAWSSLPGSLFNNSGWVEFEADPQGRGKYGWEELPYWLKGYGDLGYVLKDPAIVAEAKKWIEAVLATQRDDGWFGPRELLTSLDGKADLWPQMTPRWTLPVPAQS